MRRLLVSMVPLALISAAVPTLVLAAETTATYPVGNVCGGTVPACEPAQDFTVTTDGVLRAEVAVTFTCIATTVYFSVDGEPAATSAPVPAGANTGVVNLGPVAPGTHTLTVAADVPISIINCDSRSWSGILSVTSSGVTDDDVAFANPGDTVTVSTAVAGSPRPAGITATLDRSSTATTIARISVATYDGLPFQPSPPPIRAAGYLDLQLTDGDVDDVIAGEFFPTDPLFPTDPVIPTDPLFPTDPTLPPNPIRLAHWDGDAWSPVFGAFAPRGPPILPAYDSVLNVFSVTFDSTSTPSVLALNGTVFATVPNYYFRGFGLPLNSDTLNVAKTGRAIPLKWQLFDFAVEPVTDLDPAVVKVSSVPIPCDDAGQGTDAVDEYATGASGLHSLGDGVYQFNWATPKSYAGTCRRLLLDIGERNPDGTTFYRTADFKFTR